jgi:hypothetical protein
VAEGETNQVIIIMSHHPSIAPLQSEPGLVWEWYGWCLEGILCHFFLCVVVVVLAVGLCSPVRV